MINKINADMISAMKAKETETVMVLRSLIAECKNIKIAENASTILDSHCVTAVKRTLKRMENSIELFIKGERHDLADKEKAQAAIVSVYLPKAPSASEISDAVTRAINEVGATTQKDMGKVIGAVRASFPYADMKMVTQLVKSLLA